MRYLQTPLAMILVLGISSASLAAQPDTTHLQSLAGTDTFVVQNGVQKNYYIYVKSPANQDTKKRYPVIYLLDGGVTFPMLSAYSYLLQALQELPEIIIVGISYGTNDWQQGNSRGHDFTLPSPSETRKHWGGAAKFATFLEHKLFPLIAEHYPVDEQQRILFGNSLGGQFGLYVATYKPDLFYGIIASNPAIHSNTEQFLTLPNIKEAPNKVKLFVALAEHDDERFKQPIKQWQQYWQAKSNPAWQLEIRSMAGHSHVSSIPDAFRQGLHWIIPASP